MCRRQLANIGERRGRGILIHLEQEKIGNRQIVEPPGNTRMQPDGIQRIAEDKRGAGLGIVQLLDSHRIARAKQALYLRVPECKGEISKQIFHAGFAPGIVGMQDEFGIRSG